MKQVMVPIYDMNLCDAFSFPLTLLWASGSFFMLHQLSPSSEVPIHWLKLEKKKKKGSWLLPNARVHASVVANTNDKLPQPDAAVVVKRSQIRWSRSKTKKIKEGESSENWVLSNFSHLSGVRNAFRLERMAVCVCTAMSYPAVIGKWCLTRLWGKPF